MRMIEKLLLVCVCACSAALSAGAQEWKLVWSDEFEGKAGTVPDASNWTYEEGAGGWGNQELETYCAPGKNLPVPCDATQPSAFLDGQGNLVIRARRLSTEPAPEGTWTSARMKSFGLREFQNGRMEACMKLPVGAGIWPAFWMLGTKGEWPAGGEIDILENIPEAGENGHGMGPGQIQSTIHGTTTEPGKRAYSMGKRFAFPAGHGVNDAACHVYGVIRSKDMMQFYVDDWRNPFFVVTRQDLKNGDDWPFEAPFYFLMNLAIGGGWPGPPDATTKSPAEVVVDYVRVYEAEKPATLVIASEPVLMGTDGTGSTTLEFKASAGTGLVYVTCSSVVPGTRCEIESGNALNAAVLDLRGRDEAKARLKVIGTTVKVTVEAFPEGGGHGELKVEVRRGSH
jgi:beta-glucanase (GH16 family)